MDDSDPGMQAFHRGTALVIGKIFLTITQILLSSKHPPCYLIFTVQLRLWAPGLARLESEFWLHHSLSYATLDKWFLNRGAVFIKWR